MAPASKATQSFVPIKEVKNGVIILKDGSMRSILIASSVNFALKSVDEQQAIIYQFQNFLNSIDFSVQISIQSRRLDIRPYVNLLENRQKEQMDDLMKIQIREYIEFIRTFTDEVEVMTKNFYIVIPYTPPALDVSEGNMFKSGKKGKKTDLETFEEDKIQLDQRISVVEQGLSRCGIRTVPLGTEEIIEVFYKIFNPGDVEKSLDLDLSQIQ
jgi:type IV secretory pathway VirB4 component